MSTFEISGKGFADEQHFRLNHTNFRIKDPKVSLPFYQEILGFELVDTLHFPEDKFSMYFLGFPDRGDDTHRPHRRAREGLLELCHQHGSENDPEFKYHTGNEEPQGFGHIAITVDDVVKTCKYFEEKGVKFQKKQVLTDGKLNYLAFIHDPDGYWIEVVGNGP